LTNDETTAAMSSIEIAMVILAAINTKMEMNIRARIFCIWHLEIVP
jgi:hypothetical protein